MAIAPLQSDGIEFPAAVRFGNVGRSDLRSLIAHELARQWCYALGYCGGPSERAAPAEQADV